VPFERGEGFLIVLRGKGYATFYKYFSILSLNKRSITVRGKGWEGEMSIFIEVYAFAIQGMIFSERFGLEKNLST
jgi:hypothetical protein